MNRNIFVSLISLTPFEYIETFCAGMIPDTHITVLASMKAIDGSELANPSQSNGPAAFVNAG
jgi:hypothetical protein